MAILKITEEFLLHLRCKADDAISNAAHGGRYDDGGGGHLRELICAYTSGRDGLIPSFWIEEIKKFEKEKDTEYQEYLRLKAKYERK